MNTLIRSSALLLAALTSTLPLAAQERPETAGRPATAEHVVRRGDTLWDLARHYLSNPFGWPAIFEANREQIRNPDLIYPEQRFLIPPLSTAVAMPEPAQPEPQAPLAEALPEAVPVLEREPEPRTRFYAGAVSRPAEEPVEHETMLPPPPAPEIQPGEFYSAAWLAERALEVVGRFVDKRGRGQLRQHEAQSAHPYDVVYLSYQGSRRPQVGDRLMLVRVGRAIGGLGRMVEPTAVVTVTELHAEVMTAVVQEQFDAARRGDLAVPLEPFPLPPGAQAQAVEAGPTGELVDFQLRQPLYAPTDHGFIDIGRAAGVGIGDELVVYRPERRAGGLGSERLPAEPIARMVVVRVGERSATVRVTDLDQPVLDRGMPVRVVRQMR